MFIKVCGIELVFLHIGDKDSLCKSRYKRLFSLFRAHIPVVFEVFGKAAGTGYQDYPEVLLAPVDICVILLSAVLP